MTITTFLAGVFLLLAGVELGYLLNDKRNLPLQIAIIMLLCLELIAGVIVTSYIAIYCSALCVVLYMVRIVIQD